MLNPPLLLRRPDVQTSSKKEPPPLKYSSWARAWRAQGHTYINGGADAWQEFFFVTNCHHTG